VGCFRNFILDFNADYGACFTFNSIYNDRDETLPYARKGQERTRVVSMAGASYGKYVCK
jgi:hypothetical protein